jgi:hypothetical protein
LASFSSALELRMDSSRTGGGGRQHDETRMAATSFWRNQIFLSLLSTGNCFTAVGAGQFLCHVTK